MGKFAAGDVVLVPFPFSDLKGQKVRPALVLAKVEFANLILCQITSRAYSSKLSIKIGSGDFESGSLPVASFVRVDKLFTADQTLIKGVAGKLKKTTRSKIIKKVRSLFIVT